MDEQTDGQTEVLNWCLQLHLRSFVHEKTLDRVHFHIGQSGVTIHLTVLHNFPRSRLSYVEGKPPASILTYIPSSTNLEALDSKLKTRDEILESVKTSLSKAQKKDETNC